MFVFMVSFIFKLWYNLHKVLTCRYTASHMSALCSCHTNQDRGHFMVSFLFYFLFLNIYLFLAVLGLSFCARASSSCGKWGPLFIAVRRPLTVAASLVAEHRLQTRRLSSCRSWAYLLRGMWDLPRPGLEPVSSALAGRFSTTAPPGKPPFLYLYFCFLVSFRLICNVR